MSGFDRSPRYWFPKRYADFVQRLRVASGFLLLVTFAWLSHPLPLSIAAGLPLAVTGLLIRGWAAGHLAKDRSLATGGPYAYIRNPLYAGTLFTALGLVIAASSAILAVIFGAVFVLVYLPVIELEEQHLRNIFPEYESYAARVHRLIPTAKRTSSGTRFSFALYRRNQEHKAALGFLLAAVWLAWKCWFD